CRIERLENHESTKARKFASGSRLAARRVTWAQVVAVTSCQGPALNFNHLTPGTHSEFLGPRVHLLIPPSSPSSPFPNPSHQDVWPAICTSLPHTLYNPIGVGEVCWSA